VSHRLPKPVTGSGQSFPGRQHLVSICSCCLMLGSGLCTVVHVTVVLEDHMLSGNESY